MKWIDKVMDWLHTAPKVRSEKTAELLEDARASEALLQAVRVERKGSSSYSEKHSNITVKRVGEAHLSK
ncbi:MAG TPA: hypothetical protein PKD70_12415 [Saprospiraceae bacterium]|nr:hypothetical protein [Saprospiraceae bacterium]HMP14677.1 hypothetical protein [Saprospiraceae bacterium]